MATRQADIELELPIEQAYRIVSCRIEEGISRHTRAEIELATHEDLDLRRALHRDVAIRLTMDGALARVWTLRLARARFAGAARGSARHRIELFDPLYFLGLSTNTRKFRNMSTHDIVSAVLREGRVPFEFRTARDTPKRKYCSQYRETNLAFVLRLLEYEGIYYTVEPDGALILADRSGASPPVDGQQHYELIDAAGAMDRDEIGIYELTKGAKVTPGAATVNDFNWKRPNRPLRATSAEGEDADLEVYEDITGYRSPEQGELFARLRREARRAEARWVDGEGSAERFAPARIFSFGAEGGEALAGEYLLTSVEHAVEQPGYDGGDEMPRLRYRNRFRAIPREVPFRPPLVTPRPTVQGCHTAMVRGPIGEEIHTDKHGRFRAQFHWDREATGTDADSRWVRMLQEPSTSMQLARVGWEMIIAYIDGDPDRPIGIGRHINGVMIPAYAQPASKNVMTIKTPTSPATGGYNEIRLDDSAAAMRFDVRAERDFATIVRHDRSEEIGNCETHFVGLDFSRKVKLDQAVAVGANQIVEVDNDERWTVFGDRDKSVGGDEQISVGVAMVEAARADELESVGGVRHSVVGTKPLESYIRRIADRNLSRGIGGSLLQIAGAGVTARIGGDYTESVGGNKISVAAEGDWSQAVTGPYTLDVGGGVMRQSGTDMGVGATSSFVNVGAGASLSAGEILQVTGKEITMEASSAFDLVSGGLSIAMTPGSTSITGKLRCDAPSQVVVSGGPENIT